MSSNYQQKKMMNALGAIDTKGNIVLEQFQDGTALLFQPGNAQPFCVATDYDRATASWSYGKYFSDLGCAHEAADPEIIEDASVRWGKEDIREKLKAQDIAPTEFNVQMLALSRTMEWTSIHRHLKSNRDMNSIGAPSRMTVLLMTEIPFRIKILIHGCNMNFMTYVFMFSRDFSIHTHRLRSNWITRCFPSSPPPAKTPSRSAPMNTDSGKVSTLSCR